MDLGSNVDIEQHFKDRAGRGGRPGEPKKRVEAPNRPDPTLCPSPSQVLRIVSPKSRMISAVRTQSASGPDGDVENVRLGRRGHDHQEEESRQQLD